LKERGRILKRAPADSILGRLKGEVGAIGSFNSKKEDNEFE
jgi:hypothetical protein